MAGAGPRHHAAQILWRGEARGTLGWTLDTVDVDSVVITIKAVLYLDTVTILLPLMLNVRCQTFTTFFPLIRRQKCDNLLWELKGSVALLPKMKMKKALNLRLTNNSLAPACRCDRVGP